MVVGRSGEEGGQKKRSMENVTEMLKFHAIPYKKTYGGMK